jgi:hypothetical protein
LILINITIGSILASAFYERVCVDFAADLKLGETVMQKNLVVAISLGFGVIASSVPRNSAHAAPVFGSTLAPNWALGVPQRPFIGMCSDFPGACFGNFGLGPESDVLNVYWAGTPAIVQASLNEAANQFVFGRLETANEGAGLWWDLTVPNAVWLGLAPGAGIVYYLNDGSAPAGFATDAIAFANTGPGGLAQIWWASVFDPPDFTLLPPDFVIDVGTFTAFDVTSAGNGSGLFSESSFNPPNMDPCNPSDPNLTGSSTATALCLQDDAVALANGPLLPTFVPEPGSLAILGTALAGFTWLRRRKTKAST